MKWVLHLYELEIYMTRSLPEILHKASCLILGIYASQYVSSKPNTDAILD
jgi:hypothetical protein